MFSKKIGEHSTLTFILLIVGAVLLTLALFQAIRHMFLYDNIVVGPSGRSYIVPSYFSPLSEADANTVGTAYDAKIAEAAGSASPGKN